MNKNTNVVRAHFTCDYCTMKFSRNFSREDDLRNYYNRGMMQSAVANVTNMVTTTRTERKWFRTKTITETKDQRLLIGCPACNSSVHETGRESLLDPRSFDKKC